MTSKTTYKHAENYNVEVLDDNGNIHLMHSNQLQQYKLHYWKNWKCNAGIDGVYVNEKGDLWVGVCLNTYLGNLNDEYNLPTSAVVCKQLHCSGCTTDLAYKKVIDLESTSLSDIN